MKRLTVFLFSLCLILSGVSAYGQEQRFFYSISVESGMPHSEVVAIEEDSSGFLWFGTYNGLARYDGYSLMNITKDFGSETHKSLRVTSLHCDTHNSLLYIGTDGDGLKIMDLNTYSIIERLWFANSIHCIKEGDNDDLWIGTERGIVRLSYSSGSFQYRYCESTLSKVSDIIRMNEHTLLVASGSGVFSLDLSSGYLTNLQSGHARCIHMIDDSRYLLGTSRGLYIYDSENSNVVRQIDYIDVYAIHKSSDGRWWVGSIDSGLYRFSEDFTHKTSFYAGNKEGLPDNGIRALMEDFSGNLWIGTQNGVCKYYTRAESFDFYADALNENNSCFKSNQTASFWEDSQGRLWIGKYHSGLKILDRKTSEVYSFTREQLPDLDGATISSFFTDQEGNLWIGTWNGLYIMRARYIDKAPHYRHIPLIDFATKHQFKGVTIFKILNDKDGGYWMSTNNGLYRFIPSDENEFEGELHNYFPSVITTDFHIDYSPDNDRIIWLGTQKGLNKVVFSKNSTKPTLILVNNQSEDNANLLDGFTSAVYSDSSDRLWVLGLDGYISVLTSGRYGYEAPTFRTLDINENGTADTAESLLEDNSGNLWIGGVRMMKFNPEKWTVEYFDESDGLQNRSFKIWSSAKLSSGELVFGGINGFSIFNPDNLQKNNIAPKLVLEDLYLTGNKIEVGEKIKGKTIINERLDLQKRITIPHSHNNISITFAALHYTSPLKNRYRYILKGYEETYHEVSGDNPRVTYQNLPPGNYEFILEGSNNDGIWADNPKSLKIRVTPPIWLSAPAIILYIFILAFVIFAIFKALMQREKNRAQTRLYELKLKYFTDISHEIKTPLSLISSPIDEIYEDPDLDSKTQRKLALVKKNISRLMDLIEQIIDINRFESDIMSLKLSQQDLINICRTCMSYFEDKAERKDIYFHFETNSPQIQVWVDRERIEKLLFNIIGNAFKFTPEGGHIEIRCELRKNDVLVSIADTGIGIEPDRITHIFERFYTGDKNMGSGIGLALAKAIIEQHYGKIWVESQVGKKTIFYFTILLGDSHFSEQPLAFKSPYDQENELSSYTIIREKNIAELNLYKGDYISKGKASVLIVEDDPDLREYLKESLSQHFLVSASCNGVEAYEAAVNNDFDCIVSDIFMPVMDGVEFCIKAKSDILLSHIPIILLTAKDSVEDKISGFGAGADDYITKPFDMKLLITRINNLIRQRQDLKAKFHNHITVAPSMMTISSIDEQFMQKCLSLIEKNISDSNYNVENLCNDLSMSRPTVYKKIKSLTGLSVVAFIRSIRLKRAAQLLSQDGSSIKNVMYMVGFDNSSYFSARFKKEFGCTPNEFVEKHKTV